MVGLINRKFIPRSRSYTKLCRKNQIFLYMLSRFGGFKYIITETKLWPELALPSFNYIVFTLSWFCISTFYYTFLGCNLLDRELFRLRTQAGQLHSSSLIHDLNFSELWKLL